MTSCDENLYRQIMILLYSISKNLSDYSVNFYLFRRNEFSENKIHEIKEFSSHLGNIIFHDIIVNEAEKYDALAEHGGSWSGEAYFSLCAHEYLPEDSDRVLYLDAGDVIVTDDIQSFYFENFEDNVILSANVRTYRKDDSGVLRPVVYYDENDIYDSEKRKDILGSTFNSGSYMLNLKKLRDSELTLDDYVTFMNWLLNEFGADTTYFGDQGFLSACFLGDIKYFDINCGAPIFSSKYNFEMGWYQLFPFEPPYNPSIVHFVGAPKPWTVKYSESLSLFPDIQPTMLLEKRLPEQKKWYNLWREYAETVNETN